MTSTTLNFGTNHEELIHGVSYDFYGKRLVTCSSDQRLKVWDLTDKPDASVWELNDVWKAHDASILKAVWARPEYGQIIASCSFDRQVKIWEEQTIELKNSHKRWIERFRLVESRGAVLDIAFAPSQNSLRLATCSSDGIVRIYEALEPSNLTHWSQMEEFEITNNNTSNIANNSSAYNEAETSKNLASGITLLQQQQQQQKDTLQQQFPQQQQQDMLQQQEQQDTFQQQEQEILQQQQHHDMLQQQQQSQQQQDQQEVLHQQKQHQQFEQQQQQYQTHPLQQYPQQQQQLQHHQSQPMMQTISLPQSQQPLPLTQPSQPLQTLSQNPPQPQMISQYGFYQTSVLQASQPLQPQQTHTYMNSSHGYQPINTQSTSSSLSSHTSPGLSTPGVSDIPTMTSTAVNPNAGQGYAQGVSPVSSIGIGGVQTAMLSNTHKPIDADSGYCIDWCPNRTPIAMMVVGLGKEIGARIFKHDGHNRWIPAEYLPGHTQEVHDVSWAPNMAKSYQLIATACKDHLVRIYKLTEQTVQHQQQQLQASHRGRNLNSPIGNSFQSNNSNKTYNVELIASFGDHKAEVWKVEWNITGTILSSSGDDGKLRLWTAEHDGNWRQMAAITANI